MAETNSFVKFISFQIGRKSMELIAMQLIIAMPAAGKIVLSSIGTTKILMIDLVKKTLGL
jgi:hypothetical protein